MPAKKPKPKKSANPRKTSTEPRQAAAAEMPRDGTRAGVLAAAKKGRKGIGTQAWGKSIKTDDFVAVPRALIRLGRHDPELRKVLKPQHLQLLMALAARKYQQSPIRAYWQTLATDLGVSVPTVRRWGYELRDAKLLTIRNRRKRGESVSSGEPSLWRNDRNYFDLTPLEIRLKRSMQARKKELQERKASRREPVDE